MILVTGGTGLVGAHLLYHLTLNDTKIRAIYRSKEKLKQVERVFSFYTSDVAPLFSKIEWIQADITNMPSMIRAFKDVKQVYHCAALVSFNPKDYIEMRKVNIHGTAIVVNLSIDQKIDKLCFVSSIAAIGSSINNELITEENEWNDADDNHGYAITKFGAEMEVWRASQEGIDVVIVNPGVILGSGFWHSGSGKIFTQVYKGFNFYTEGVTGFVSVKDVVKIMIELMRSPIKNNRFILVAENKSFKEIFFLIADGFSKKRPHKKAMPWQTSVLWRMAWFLSKITGKKPLLTKHSAKSIHSVFKYSSKKLKKISGYVFENIEDSVSEICKDYPK